MLMGGKVLFFFIFIFYFQIIFFLFFVFYSSFFFPIFSITETDANIIVIVVGNPRGFISSHHEKLVLIDAGCDEHSIAFTV